EERAHLREARRREVEVENGAVSRTDSEERSPTAGLVDGRDRRRSHGGVARQRVRHRRADANPAGLPGERGQGDLDVSREGLAVGDAEIGEPPPPPRAAQARADARGKNPGTELLRAA